MDQGIISSAFSVYAGSPNAMSATYNLLKMLAFHIFSLFCSYYLSPNVGHSSGWLFLSGISWNIFNFASNWLYLILTIA